MSSEKAKSVEAEEILTDEEIDEAAGNAIAVIQQQELNPIDSLDFDKKRKAHLRLG